METSMNQYRKKRMSFGCDEDEREIGALADPDPHRRPYVLSSHYGRGIVPDARGRSNALDERVVVGDGARYGDPA